MLNAVIGQTPIFVWAGIIALFFAGFFFCRRGLVHSSVVSGLMISLGIFGTFYGISDALIGLDFTPEKMNDSVTALLNGMKTAFASSLLGLGSAIIFKTVFSIILEPLDQLRGEKKPQNLVHKDMNERLDAIKQAIAGDSDSSLVTQIQQLRQENKEGYKKLDGLSETIREELVKNLGRSMKTLTEKLEVELKKLTEELRNALIDEFGASFREFNNAVQALNQWQGEHKQQVEQLTLAFDETAQGIAKIKENCDAIPGTMGQLEEIVKVVNHQINELNARLEAFANMRQQAEQSFPVIKDNLDKIGQNLADSAKGLSNIESTINQSINDVVKNMKAQVAVAMEEFDKKMTKMVEGMQQSAEKSQEAVNDKIVEITAKMQENINTEIDRVTQEWGSNMLAIAEKCREAVAAAEKSKSGGWNLLGGKK